jgi:hypothetical protein
MTDATAAWIAERLPTGRDLNADELTELAAALGRERALWKHLVRHGRLRLGGNARPALDQGWRRSTV